MIQVNEQFDVEWEEGMTVERLLERLRFSFPLIIVSVDGVMVSKAEYSTYLVPDGGQVKVLHMIAGG